MSNSEKPDFGESVKDILAELEVELSGEKESEKKFNTTATLPIPGVSPPTPPTPSPRLAEERVVIQAPVLQDVEEHEEGGLRIKAQISADEMECKFMFSRPLLAGFSWWFGHPQDGGGSPLADKLFALDGVSTLLIDDTILIVTRSMGALTRWEDLAAEIGRVARVHLEADEPILGESTLDRIPSETELEARIQQVIDEEVNPGVAAHSGHISLERVRGNAVYIRMGGGCQGCSAASLTLKQGIHSVFRDAVPELGAIYDETDHAAGENPYFS